MARKVINLGVVPYGIGGDDNRTAMTKINDNFLELYEGGGGGTGGSGTPAYLMPTPNGVPKAGNDAKINSGWITYFQTTGASTTGGMSQKAITDALALVGGGEGKVDKVAGKSLVLDTEISKLSKIQTAATANSPDSFLLDRGNHTGTQAIETVDGLPEALALAGVGGVDGKVDKEVGKSLISVDEIARLVKIEDEATRNSPDDFLLKRENHTGEQPIDTIVGLSNELETITTEIETLNTTMGDITTILDEILGESI